MKNFLFIIGILVTFNVIAELNIEKPRKNFQIYQIDKNTDIGKLKAHKNYLSNTRPHKILPARVRDEILGKYLPEKDLALMDELNKDLYAKSIVHLTEDQFFKKYKDSISLDNYKKLRQELLELEK